MKSIKCDIVGCEENADFITDSDNYVCESHMWQEIEENGYEPEDYEPIEEYLKYTNKEQ
jgi:hypothetical protein